MRLMFSKYEGAGNDFVLIYDRGCMFPTGDASLISKICDRRFGVGGDGLMLLRPSTKLDFKMIYFNSDGHEGSMCGNGGRCFAAFARDMGLLEEETAIRFEAMDGIHEAVFEDKYVRLKMKDVDKVEKSGQGFFVNTGSPHYVELLNSWNNIDFVADAGKIRNSQEFAPEGVNVNMAVKIAENTLENRTFERGVEDETLACGTGSVALALCADSLGLVKSPVSIKMPGGNLWVSYIKEENMYKEVWLKGEANFVFQGQVEV